jgi:hypothetical protein
MAAFVLFVVAVAGGVVVADLVWENPTVGQVTVFSHTVGGYPEGWVLATAAGLGFVVACCWSPPSTRRRDDGRAARNSDVCGMPWRTRRLRPSPIMLACWMRSSALRNPPATPTAQPGRSSLKAKAERAESKPTSRWSHPNRSSSPPSRSTSR